MSYNQYPYEQNPYPQNPYGTPPPPPPQQAYIPPTQQAKPEKEKGNNKGWIITGIVVPLLAALIAGGYFGIHAATNGPSIPTLHSTYTGSAINLVGNTQFGISMINVAENTNTGEFTANGSAQSGGVTCVGQITNGLVKTDGSITFEFQEQANVTTGCPALVSNFTGQVDSAGNIRGTWSSDAGGNGSFTLS